MSANRIVTGLAAGLPQRRAWIPALPHLGPFLYLSVAVLGIVVLAAVFAPLIAHQDPRALDPGIRLKGPSLAHLLGTDAYGRDMFARLVHGARVSLTIGIGAALISVGAGLVLGLVAGFVPAMDAVIMRIVDGLMAIPNILLAIAIVALVGGSLSTVLVAITVPEIPRVVRLVRAIVLSTCEEPYVEAAIALGTSTPRIMWRHLAPATLPPLIVQATYVCASAILIEAILSFLGAGISPETSSWGNIMADGRTYFRLMPSLIFWPGLLLSLTILAINHLGDAARDALDPRLARRGGLR